MKKINILLAVAFSFGLAGCYDLDKMPDTPKGNSDKEKTLEEDICGR